MRARESNSIDSVDLADGDEKVSEERTGPTVGQPLLTGNFEVVVRRVECPTRACEVAAIGIHVLTEQGDFPHTIGSQSLDFAYQFAEWATDFATANCGNDAIGAGVVATNLNRDPGRPIHFATNGKCRWERVSVIKGFIPNLSDGTVATRFMEQLHGAMDIVRSNHNIDMACSLRDLLAIFLRQAPAHDDFHVGAFFFDVLESPEVSVELVVGVLTNATGVEHHDIGVLIGIGEHEPVRFEQARYAFRIVLVHLTPIGADGIAAGYGTRRRGRSHCSNLPALFQLFFEPSPMISPHVKKGGIRHCWSSRVSSLLLFACSREPVLREPLPKQ